MFVGNTRGLGETLHCVGSYSQMVWKINCLFMLSINSGSHGGGGMTDSNMCVEYIKTGEDGNVLSIVLRVIL